LTISSSWDTSNQRIITTDSAVLISYFHGSCSRKPDDSNHHRLKINPDATASASVAGDGGSQTGCHSDVLTTACGPDRERFLGPSVTYDTRQFAEPKRLGRKDDWTGTQSSHSRCECAQENWPHAPFLRRAYPSRPPIKLKIIPWSETKRIAVYSTSENLTTHPSERLDIPQKTGITFIQLDKITLPRALCEEVANASSSHESSSRTNSSIS